MYYMKVFIFMLGVDNKKLLEKFEKFIFIDMYERFLISK